MIEQMHHVPTWVVWSPTIAMLVGFGLAYLFYIRRQELPGKLAAQHEPVYNFLLNKWYFDELYDLVFVRPAKWLGRFLWKKGDGLLIDGLGPDGVSARVIDVTNHVIRLQTGYVYHYAFGMLIGVAGLVTWLMFGGTH
jgi:NADH-quinone oxidoreductase subunit L